MTRESVYQSILSDVRDVIQCGGVRLAPEPENPFDANAIAFQCMHHGEWKTIGYVVAEVCEDVLAASLFTPVCTFRNFATPTC